MSRTAARSVTVIPPTINPLTHLSKVAIQKRRVAGYARVSTDLSLIHIYLGDHPGENAHHGFLRTVRQ